MQCLCKKMDTICSGVNNLSHKNLEIQIVITEADYPRKSFLYFFPRQTYPNLFFNLFTNMKKRSEPHKRIRS